VSLKDYSLCICAFAACMSWLKHLFCCSFRTWLVLSCSWSLLEATSLFHAIPMDVSLCHGLVLHFGWYGSFAIQKWIYDCRSLFAEQELLGAKMRCHSEFHCFQLWQLVDWILPIMVDLCCDLGTRGLGLEFWFDPRRLDSSDYLCRSGSHHGCSDWHYAYYFEPICHWVAIPSTHVP